MFPPIEPFHSGLLEVDAGQFIHWELSGNPQGQPALFLHGGPGAGGLKGYRKLFDPEKYLIVYLDQRGCGQSKPLLQDFKDLSGHRTQDLIGDIEKLRQHLGIESWLVNGVSWGSTLALAYAQAHPEKVTGVILSSVTVTSKEEVEWMTEGVGRLFPLEWEQFAASVQCFAGDRVIDRFYSAITNSDVLVRQNAADAWCRWENVHISLAPDFKPMPIFADPRERLRFATFVIHYWKHAGFLSEQPILSNMQALRDIPGVMIHGRYDVSLPARTVWELHRLWPLSRVIIVADEGHGGPKMSEEMCVALSSFAQQSR